MQIVELIQNSEAWLDFRKGKLGGSSAPIVMGVSPYMTPYQLYKVMRGEAEPPNFDNPAIRKGHEIEPVARARYNFKHERNFQPVVIQSADHPWAMVSLDGFEVTEDGREGWEGKCVRAEVFDMALAGIVHPEYVPQLEHQLWVGKLDVIHFHCVRAEDNGLGKWEITGEATVHYRSNPAYRDELIAKEIEFMERIQTGNEPPLTSKDTLLRTEADVRKVWAEMRDLKKQLDEKESAVKTVKEALDAAKARAIELMKHSKEQCEGLVLTKQESSKLDTNAVKAKGVDIADCYKPSVSYVLRWADGE